MNTLQTQYNQILKGKGNKEVFLKEAKRIFPQFIHYNFSYDQTLNELKRRKVIYEIKSTEPEIDFFKVFKENLEVDIKANAKKTHASVEDKQIAGFNYKDKENIDNVFGQQFLIGFMAEMDDPKNLEKTVEEIKQIVAKNLTKDQLYYIKDGVFGVKGIGYTSMPETKEITTGNFKSSGMEKAPTLNESIRIESLKLIKPGGIIAGYEAAVALAKKTSKEEDCTKHVNEIRDGIFKLSDWYDEDTTVISFESGRQLNEIQDINDPILMKLRANKNKPQPQLSLYKPKAPNLNALKIRELEDEIEELMYSMEQEAEPEGGPMADMYGDLLDKLQTKLYKLKNKSLVEILDDDDDVEIEDTWNKPDVDDVDPDIEPEIDEHAEGFDACMSKKSIKNNPYSLKGAPRKFKKWNEGYREAEKLMKGFDGDDEDSYGIWETKKKLKETISDEKTGLNVTPSSDEDKEKLDAWLEESDFYGEYDPMTSSYFFPEAPELYDELEQNLQDEFESFDIRVRFEGLWEENLNKLGLLESHTDYPDMPGFDLIEKISEDFGKGSKEYTKVEDIIFNSWDQDTNKISYEGVKKLSHYLSSIGVADDIDYEECLYDLHIQSK